jgi:hypothetical protein
VAQRPGKPAGCCIGPAGQVIMALPGNPVSALTGRHAFVLPALAAASGLPTNSAMRAEIEKDLKAAKSHYETAMKAIGTGDIGPDRILRTGDKPAVLVVNCVDLQLEAGGQYDLTPPAGPPRAEFYWMRGGASEYPVLQSGSFTLESWSPSQASGRFFLVEARIESAGRRVAKTISRI